MVDPHQGDLEDKDMDKINWDRAVLRFVDDHGVAWNWDGEWLDVDYVDEEPEEGSGYPAASYDDVVEILATGGYIDVYDKPLVCHECFQVFEEEEHLQNHRVVCRI